MIALQIDDNVMAYLVLILQRNSSSLHLQPQWNIKSNCLLQDLLSIDRIIHHMHSHISSKKYYTLNGGSIGFLFLNCILNLGFSTTLSFVGLFSCFSFDFSVSFDVLSILLFLDTAGEEMDRFTRLLDEVATEDEEFAAFFCCSFN
jgi:hypothetical protein